jgi:hypothetical protein
VDLAGGKDELDLTNYFGAVDVSGGTFGALNGGVETILCGANDNFIDLGTVISAPHDGINAYQYDTDPFVDGGGGFDTVVFKTDAEAPLNVLVSSVERVTGGASADHIDVWSAPDGISVNLRGGADIFTFELNSSTAKNSNVQNFQHGLDKIDLSPYHLTLLGDDLTLNGHSAQATIHYDGANNVSRILINDGLNHVGVDEQINVFGAHLNSTDFIV